MHGHGAAYGRFGHSHLPILRVFALKCEYFNTEDNRAQKGGFWLPCARLAVCSLYQLSLSRLDRQRPRLLTRSVERFENQNIPGMIIA